jgi:hypothetical protein
MTDANAVIHEVLAADEDFTTVDTTVVQVRSVLNFMYALGYVLDADVKTARFITESKTSQANRYLSIHTAIRMHNMPAERWEIVADAKGDVVARPQGVNLKNGFTVLGVRLAFASKLVPQVKFSVTRTGAIVTQYHLVRPLNETVRQLIEG